MLELESNVKLLVESIADAIACEGTSAKHFDLADLALTTVGQLSDCLNKQALNQHLHEIHNKLNDAAHRLEVAMMEYRTRKDTKRTLAKSGIEAKLKIDPKQQAKAEIAKEFNRWMANQSNFRDGAKFALKMVELHIDKDGAPLLTTKTVESWVTQWRKDAKQKMQNPVS